MPRPERLIAGLLACLIAGLGGASPATAATQTAQVSANIVKPLTLSWLQDLDLGSIVLGPGSWSNATVAISRTGAFSCTSPNVTCSGVTKPAKYNVTGTNNQVVRVTAPDITLVNAADPTKTLLLTIDSPGTVALTSSGKPGNDFVLGGSVVLSSTTAGGTYSGTFNVTVDY